MTIYGLEASDDYGLEGLRDEEGLHRWLESWLLDDDSRECKLVKLSHFEPQLYSDPIES